MDNVIYSYSDESQEDSASWVVYLIELFISRALREAAYYAFVYHAESQWKNKVLSILDQNLA